MKIHKFKNNNNKNGIILLHFVTSYSILLIFVLIIGLFLYQFGMKDAKNDLHKQNKTMLDKSVATLDESIQLMNTLVTQISNDSSLRSLIKMDNTKDNKFQTNARTAMNVLSDFYPIETLLPLHDFYIYLPKVNYVLSANMLSEVPLFYKYYKSFDQTLYSDWFTMLNSNDDFRNFIEMQPYYQGGFSSFLYKVPMSTSYLTNTIPAIVCFEISKSGLNDIFSTINLFDSGFIVVKDTNNNEVFRITSKETNSNSIVTLLDKVTNQQFDSSKDSNEIMLNNESIVVTKALSSHNEWTYYLVQPSDLVFNDLKFYQNAYIIIIALTCLFCGVLIYFLSKRNMRPIIEIRSKLEDSIQEKDSLALKLEEQRPIIYHSFMARIMKGLITNDQEAEDIKNFLGLNTPNTKYSVLYASVYEHQVELYVEDTVNASDADSIPRDYREIIRSYLYNYFGENILIYEASINSFAILLTTDASISRDEINQIIKDKFIELHNDLMSEHDIWIFGGLGHRNTQLTYLWKSYQQAMQAVSFIHEGNVFQAFTDIKRDKTSYYYPVEMAQQLSNFIQTGNEKQVHEIFRLIKKLNFEDVSLPMSLIKWLLSDIRNTLLKVRFHITITEDNQSVIDFIDTAFQQTKTLELMEDISVKLCTLNEQKVEGNRLITSIQTYIKENYMDSSLSLKKISEVFDISESYFSYLFKAETKQNFSEYLELIRMDQAMILLKTTDINVSDMYLELGYNNANSFRRAFKKIHGVSPKMIREANIASTQDKIDNTLT